MPKIKYLTGKGPDRKLKRNVPKDIVVIAKLTAWTERVGTLSQNEIKERANLFGVRTDSEINRLRSIKRTKIEPATPTSLELSKTRSEQIAHLYFTRRDEKNIVDRAYYLGPDRDNKKEMLALAIDDLRSAQLIAGGVGVSSDSFALQLLENEGVISPEKRSELMNAEGRKLLKNHRGFKYFCTLIERADITLADKKLKSWEQGHLVEADDAFFMTPLKIVETQKLDQAPSITLSDLIERFMHEKLSQVSSSRYSQYRIAAKALNELIGTDYLLTQITRDDARRVTEFLPKIPAYVSEHYKGQTLEQAAEQYKLQHGTYVDRWKEGGKNLQVINQFFKFAIDEQMIGRNPFSGLHTKPPKSTIKKYQEKRQTYKQFTIEQLRIFFDMPLYRGCVDDERNSNTKGLNIFRRHRYWAPIISLFSGMRMGEILQLEIEDIQQSENGTWFFSINDQVKSKKNDSTFDKRLKTTHAIRKISLHPILIEFGFLRWANDNFKTGRIFPEAVADKEGKLSTRYSKRFATNTKAAGIYERRRLVFHSFRNNFNEALRNAGVPVELRNAINGWQPASTMDSKYGAGEYINHMYKEISRAEYSGLNLDHLKKY